MVKNNGHNRTSGSSLNQEDFGQQLVPKNENCDTKPISLLLSESKRESVWGKGQWYGLAGRIFQHRQTQADSGVLPDPHGLHASRNAQEHPSAYCPLIATSCSW